MGASGQKARFLANMNISPKTVDALRREGWDIVRVSDLLPPTASDEEVLELARREDRVVITQDLDFSALLALGGHSRPSVIPLRLTFTDPDTVTRGLPDTVPGVEQRLPEGVAVTIEDSPVRFRSLPIT